ncbi:hypothetical protein QSH57_011827 [Fusarium oxysporum f. sp. vasinfectum]|nr:hypothetical protein QSH57_011827 [Fusarium oxysporum f. sp. vasinfectum]
MNARGFSSSKIDMFKTAASATACAANISDFLANTLDGMNFQTGGYAARNKRSQRSVII